MKVPNLPIMIRATKILARWNQTTAIYIAIEESLSLNDAL